MILKLPDDVLCLVLQHIDFQDKCRMQLVCRKFSALLSSPPPGLWGEVNLVTNIINRNHKNKASRWLIRRIQGFASIICDTEEDCPNDPRALYILMAKLSGAFTKGAELTIVFTAGLTTELLQGVSAGPANSKLLDYWATLSSCLTDLEFLINPMEKQLQPAYLNQLTRLTRLAFSELLDPEGHAHQGAWPHYVFKLPELKALELDSVWLGDLELQCPQLKLLRIEGSLMEKLSLQASLEDLHLDNCTPDFLHEGFPNTNLIGLTYLSLGGVYQTGSEAALFQWLPLMTELRALYLSISKFSLPAELPKTLRDLTLIFDTKKGWDSSVIPLLQQLPEVESIFIEIDSYSPAAVIGDLSLDHNLRPFLAIKSLRLLHLGNSQVWKASALRQLGELEAEVARSGKKLKLSY